MAADDASLSRLEIWALVACQPLAQLSNQALLPSLGAMRADLDLSYAELGVVVAAFGLTRLVVDLPAGNLASRWNPRSVLMISLALSVFASTADAAPTKDAGAALFQNQIQPVFAKSCLACHSSQSKQGGLDLTGTEIRWAPGLRLRGGGLLLTPPFAIHDVRAPTGSEGLRVKRGVFKIVEISSGPGELMLGLPSDSVALVVQRLGAEV